MEPMQQRLAGNAAAIRNTMLSEMARYVGDSAEARAYLTHDVPVGEHLADQLLIPLALAGGAYTTGPLSLHTTTNIEVIKKFLPVEITTTQLTEEVWKVEVFG